MTNPKKCHHWRSAVDPRSGKTYCWNRRTNHTVWDLSALFDVPAGSPVPHGWAQVVDETGSFRGGKSSWCFRDGVCCQQEQPPLLEDGWTYEWSEEHEAIGFQRLARIEEPAPLADLKTYTNVDTSSVIQKSRSAPQKYRPKDNEVYAKNVSSSSFPDELCHPWRTVTDQGSNRIYYWNKRTGQTQWANPLGAAPPHIDLPEGWAQRTNETASSSSANKKLYYVLHDSCYQAERPLPLVPPWTYEWDSNRGVVYYKHLVWQQWPVPLRHSVDGDANTVATLSSTVLPGTVTSSISTETNETASTNSGPVIIDGSAQELLTSTSGIRSNPGTTRFARFEEDRSGACFTDSICYTGPTGNPFSLVSAEHGPEKPCHFSILDTPPKFVENRVNKTRTDHVNGGQDFGTQQMNPGLWIGLTCSMCCLLSALVLRFLKRKPTGAGRKCGEDELFVKEKRALNKDNIEPAAVPPEAAESAPCYAESSPNAELASSVTERVGHVREVRTHEQSGLTSPAHVKSLRNPALPAGAEEAGAGPPPVSEDILLDEMIPTAETMESLEPLPIKGSEKQTVEVAEKNVVFTNTEDFRTKDKEEETQAERECVQFFCMSPVAEEGGSPALSDDDDDSLGFGSFNTPEKLQVSKNLIEESRSADRLTRIEESPSSVMIEQQITAGTVANPNRSASITGGRSSTRDRRRITMG